MTLFYFLEDQKSSKASIKKPLGGPYISSLVYWSLNNNGYEIVPALEVWAVK